MNNITSLGSVGAAVLYNHLNTNKHHIQFLKHVDHLHNFPPNFNKYVKYAERRKSE